MSEQETTPMSELETSPMPVTDESPLSVETPDGPGVRPEPTGPSVPTVLWGLLLGLVAAAAIAHQVSDVGINLTVGLPVVLLATGAALVAWGLAGVVRRRS
jgi:hypothetical protein